MPRITLPSFASLNEDQRRVYNEIAGGYRGNTSPPFLALLQSPELASRAQSLGEFVRYETSLPPRLSELAILVLARCWTAQYEWFVHKKEALKAGLAPEIIQDIAERKHPQFAHSAERIVYEFATALHRNHRVSSDLYAQAVEVLGQQGVVELVGLLGYYTLISMTLNVFEIDVPAGEEAELVP